MKSQGQMVNLMLLNKFCIISTGKHLLKVVNKNWDDCILAWDFNWDLCNMNQYYNVLVNFLVVPRSQHLFMRLSASNTSSNMNALDPLFGQLHFHWYHFCMSATNQGPLTKTWGSDNSWQSTFLDIIHSILKWYM